MGTAFGEINPIRLKSYRNHSTDGRGYVEYKHIEKDMVFVALIIGEEDKKIESEEQLLDIDSIILAMAEHIKAQRTPTKKAVKKKATKKKKSLKKVIRRVVKKKKG